MGPGDTSLDDGTGPLRRVVRAVLVALGLGLALALAQSVAAGATETAPEHDGHEVVAPTAEAVADEVVGPVAARTATAVRPVAVAAPTTEAVAPVAAVAPPTVAVVARAADDVDAPLAAAAAPVVTPLATATTPLARALAPVAEAVAPAIEPIVEPVVEPLAPVLEPVAPIVDGLALTFDPLAPALAPGDGLFPGLGSTTPPVDGPAVLIPPAGETRSASAGPGAPTDGPADAATGPRSSVPTSPADPHSMPDPAPVVPGHGPVEASGAGPGPVAILASSERPAVAAGCVVVVRSATIASTTFDEPSVSPD